MQEIIFFLPEKITTNKIYSGIHWTKRKKHKDAYRNSIFVSQPVKTFPVDIVYDFYFTKNALDTTNTSYMAKLIEDCLVKKGVLPDDCIKYVSSSKLYSQKGTDNVCIISISPAKEKQKRY